MVKFFPGIAWEIATGWLSKTQRIRLLLTVHAPGKYVNFKKTIFNNKMDNSTNL